MRNPFEDLGKPRVNADSGEEVGGAFSCQEQGCYLTVSVARYLAEVNLLTWECTDGHINKIEGFDIG